ncbi:MAG: hypothetical protein E7362_04900 [Clostridiales bacterium]|nr:hypothetical protein [Clostridiales bacterium]
MSKITAITSQEKDKNRCNIFVDGDFLFSVHIDTVMDYRLKAGDEISEEKLREIKLEGDKSFALKKAMKYVSGSLKTKKQVITYLRGKEFTDNAVFYAIDKLQEYGFIDDEEFARRYIESASVSKGVKLIAYKLMEKGISKEIVEKVMSEINPETKQSALNLAQKRVKGKEITSDLIRKTYAYLISKGFSYEDADYAIRSIKGD